MPTVRLLADYPDLLAAADISDAAWWGYVLDLLLVNDPGARADIRRSTGGAPNPAALGEWFKRNPLYRVNKARAAVRIEANDPLSLVTHWELYALLHDAGRPVDYVYFPEGSHNLTKPQERYESQQGNLDWFRFWLMGEEDPDKTKAAQYAYWRTLRSLPLHQ
jgi:hypothetical protein